MMLYPDFYCAATAPAALSTTMRAEVMVIGGGYTGLSAALHLAENGADVVLLEAERFGFAASGRNGGQIHSGFSPGQSALENRLGAAKARALWDFAQRAKALLHARIAQHGIDCDLRKGVLIAAHSRRAARALQAQAEFLRDRCAYAHARFLSREETNTRIGTRAYWGGLYDAGGGHLHPLRLALGLARAARQAGVSLFENSRVVALEDHVDGVVARTAAGEVRAAHAILACDAFAPALAPSLAPFLVRVESYLVATAPLPGALRPTVLAGGEAVCDTRSAMDYYRLSADDRLLFAGGETLLRPAANIEALVRPRMLRIFPQLAHIPVTHSWRGTVAITRTRMPHFGRLTPRIAFGHGYSGQGVALAIAGGKVLAEAARGESEGFALLSGMPAIPFPGGKLLRQPLAAAALGVRKLADMI